MIPAPPIANNPTLEFHVRQYVPDATGDELAHRVSLLKARDMAAALRGQARSWLAAECACLAHDIAGGLVFRVHESVPRLDLAVQLCRALVKAAMAAESLDEEEAPL